MSIDGSDHAGPSSTVVVIMELTGRGSFVLPPPGGGGHATLVAWTSEPRSIYDTRLSDEEVEAARPGRAVGPVR